MALQTAEFTSSDDWLCPAGVSAVWWQAVGGGSGTPGGQPQYGGGGSGEIVSRRLVTVIPGNTYPVVVGNKGLGNNVDGQQPTLSTASTFNGYKALGAGACAEIVPGVARGAGNGGGVGGAITNATGAGADCRGIRESCGYFGGGAGRVNGNSPTVDTDHSCGVHGGTVPSNGTTSAGQSNVGGAGAGTLWGGTNGGNSSVFGGQGISFDMDASPTHYGAGAGGNFTLADGSSPDRQGGDGAPGKVLLMWSGPP